MGVLNATPDSFYGGSRASEARAALSLAAAMVHGGADVLDIGGESTRPGAEAVSVEDELARVLPAVEALRAAWPGLPISVDTQKAEVARQALSHGADIINDISAFRSDPDMVHVAADSDAPVVVMHRQGTPQTMQKDPRYSDVVDDVKSFFNDRLAFATRHGVRENRILLDPGIGFGKTVEHNLSILRHLKEFLALGRPLLVGVSRKSFIGKLLARPSPPAQPGPLPEGEGARWAGEGILPPEERLEGSLAAALWSVQEGARGLRVHDVGATKRALRTWDGIRQA